MKFTIEELRKVYSEESLKSWTGRVEDMHGSALLAVARFSAEKQRGMEPTWNVCAALCSHAPLKHALSTTEAAEVASAMQSAAHLWMEEK